MFTSLPLACEEFALDLEKVFAISPNDIEAIIEDFHTEMKRGLFGDESSLKMIPSFVDRPKGHEKGRFIALDLGGTHLRVLAIELDGRRNATVLSGYRSAVPKAVMEGAGDQLFDFIAGCMDRFLTENNMDRKTIHDLAFIFSFPVEQTNIAAGKLIVWTKGFTATGVEGKDVIGLLNEALERRKIDCIRVTALANDTVGTLITRSYSDPACDLGVILGTGTNACYLEKCSNIRKLRGLDPKGHMIVNTEWGNFSKLKPTRYDTALDKASVNPGAMILEKMVSGMYLGELARRVLVDGIKRGLIFSNESRAAEHLKKKGSLRTEHMSLIEADKTADLQQVKAFLLTRGISNTTLYDRMLLKRLCKCISARAARLVAAAISAVITWMDPKLTKLHTVAIDGSLFEKYPGFGADMTGVFKDIYGEEADKIRLVHSKDGSGKGAAIMAAIAAST